MPFTIGQRWSSHSDKSLGLGIVRDVDFRRVTIEYPAVGETRTYATDTAPLSRIRYRENDQITDHGENQYTVQSVEEHLGLIKDAQIEFEILRNKRGTNTALMDMWRSVNSAMKMGNV